MEIDGTKRHLENVMPVYRGLETAIADLKAAGHAVDRAEFPPPPFPGLYLVDGRELTEMQVIWFASQHV